MGKGSNSPPLILKKLIGLTYIILESFPRAIFSFAEHKGYYFHHHGKNLTLSFFSYVYFFC